MILVDTDVMVDVLREFPPAIEWLGSLGDETIVLSGFVVAELLQGCRDNREQRRVEASIEGYEVTWPSDATCDRALSVFSEQRLGHGIGIIDALVGQMAVDLGEPLHTFNAKHYQCIPGIEISAPYSR